MAMPIKGDVENLVMTLKTAKLYDDRVRAAEALGKLKGSSAVEALIEALDETEDVRGWSCHVRKAAAEALGKIGDHRATEPLIRVLRDISRFREERETALDALAELQDENAVEAFFEVLSDSDLSFRAFRALEKLSSPRAKELLPVATVIAGLERGDLDSWKAAVSLGDRRTLPSLVHVLERWGKDLYLRRTYDSPIFEPDCLDDDPGHHHKICELVGLTLNVLRNMGGEEAERAIEKYGPDALILIFKDGTRKWEERELAIYSVARLQEESALEELFQALSDADVSERAFCVLEKLPSPRAKELLPVARVIVGLESHGIDCCLESAKAAASHYDPRYAPSLVHILDRWIPTLTIPVAAPHAGDPKTVLKIRILLRCVFKTLRSAGGEEAERALEKYQFVFEKGILGTDQARS